MLSSLRSHRQRMGCFLTALAKLFSKRQKLQSNNISKVNTVYLAVVVLAGFYLGRSRLTYNPLKYPLSLSVRHDLPDAEKSEKKKKKQAAPKLIHTTKETTFYAHRRLFLTPPRATRLDLDEGSSRVQASPFKTKSGLSLAFLHQYLSLMSIMVPRWRCKEAALLVSQGGFLLLRTYLSLAVAQLDGEIVRDLVAGHGQSFLWGIFRLLSFGAFAAYVNATIKYLQRKISIAFRTRLTRYIHDLYLNEGLIYYKLPNLDGSIGHSADQFITQDLAAFCDSAASLYSAIGKPLVDLCLFSYQLLLSLGPQAFSGLFANYFITVGLLRRLSPPFAKLKSIEGRREGDFRGLHLRLISNAEEIAFYGGAEFERTSLNDGFEALKSWVEGIYRIKIRYNSLEDFILKYLWSMFGYLVSSLPVFLPSWGPARSVLRSTGPCSTPLLAKDRMQTFVTNKKLMLSLADAGGRVMYSIKDVSELAGYTSRIYSLVHSLHRVHADAYYPSHGVRPELYSLSDIQGTLHRGFDGVRLENASVISPSLFPWGGSETIKSLSFLVHEGDHLFITGANSTGKSSISRMVAGLWPVYRGLVSRPRQTNRGGVMFLPQRTYLSIGTLRDQIIYPDTEEQMLQFGYGDELLCAILADVWLGYLPSREGGLGSQKDWENVLSGGEKQRMAMARLLYHEPKYAFIDDGTSAISSDVESLLYEKSKSRGVTLITISTRASLSRYHIYNLFVGLGDRQTGWSLEKIGADVEKASVRKELEELRIELSKAEEWKSRVVEIGREMTRF